MATPAPCTWWLTGLPAAGKTTLAEALAAALRAAGEPACVLDGDRVRQGLSRDLGFAEADRLEQQRRVAEMAALLNAQGIHAIAALVSPQRAGRAQARAIVGEAAFVEVHVSTPLAVCQRRDPKGLYAEAARRHRLPPPTAAEPAPAGQGLTGVDAGYEPPESPALRIDTAQLPLPQAVAALLDCRAGCGLPDAAPRHAA